MFLTARGGPKQIQLKDPYNLGPTLFTVRNTGNLALSHLSSYVILKFPRVFRRDIACMFRQLLEVLQSQTVLKQLVNLKDWLNIMSVSAIRMKSGQADAFDLTYLPIHTFEVLAYFSGTYGIIRHGTLHTDHVLCFASQRDVSHLL
ncbi:hypothetical protein ILYODFUR_010138 [Ilyodon furcidens]|uniref:Uncharacterized protein n=1 Tax=Ilyodon furcidens TaxID=33524 RepID=A0ABV0TWB2_9TELE